MGRRRSALTREPGDLPSQVVRLAAGSSGRRRSHLRQRRKSRPSRAFARGGSRRFCPAPRAGARGPRRTRMSYSFSLELGLTLSALSLGANSANAADADDSAILVTARTPVKQTASSVTLISKDDIERTQAT